jgi:hypothetical protein
MLTELRVKSVLVIAIITCQEIAQENGLSIWVCSYFRFKAWHWLCDLEQVAQSLCALLVRWD